jgi:hypothetical protein
MAKRLDERMTAPQLAHMNVRTSTCGHHATIRASSDKGPTHDMRSTVSSAVRCPQSM